MGQSCVWQTLCMEGRHGTLDACQILRGGCVVWLPAGAVQIPRGKQCARWVTLAVMKEDKKLLDSVIHRHQDDRE